MLAAVTAPPERFLMIVFCFTLNDAYLFTMREVVMLRFQFG
jgi:hypothetical protein